MINSLYALGSSEMRRARHLCDQFSALGPKFQLARRRIQAFILTQQRGHVLSQHEQRDMSQTTEELQSDIKAAELYAEQLRQSGMNILLPKHKMEIRLRTEEENARAGGGGGRARGGGRRGGGGAARRRGRGRGETRRL